MSMLRAIVKRPDEEYGHVTNVSDKLETLQKLLDYRLKSKKENILIKLILQEILIKSR